MAELQSLLRKPCLHKFTLDKIKHRRLGMEWNKTETFQTSGPAVFLPTKRPGCGSVMLSAAPRPLENFWGFHQARYQEIRRKHPAVCEEAEAWPSLYIPKWQRSQADLEGTEARLQKTSPWSGCHGYLGWMLDKLCGGIRGRWLQHIKPWNIREFKVFPHREWAKMLQEPQVAARSCIIFSAGHGSTLKSTRDSCH